MSHLIQTEPTERLHSLDTVRGFALVLGVALHASMYLPGAQSSLRCAHAAYWSSNGSR